MLPYLRPDLGTPVGLQDTGSNMNAVRVPRKIPMATGRANPGAHGDRDGRQ